MKTQNNQNGSSLPKYVEPYVILKIIVAIAVMVFIGSVLLLIGFKLPENIWSFIIREIGKAIIITALISSTIRLYFGKQLSIVEKEKKKLKDKKDEMFRNEVNYQLEDLKKQVLIQTEEIAHKATCFDALQVSSVDRFYRDRDEASKDIKATLLREGIESMKIIGISLNDYMRDENETLNGAWKQIRRYIREDELPKGASSLDIKVMFIDPCSKGAFLRGQAEGREGYEGRLLSDVLDTMRDLDKLINESSDNKNVKFDVRIYRTSPILHLIWTPHSAFLQSYHFRPRHSKGHIPVIKYHDSGEVDCMHQELESHFSYVWENCSVNVKDFVEKHSRGTEEVTRLASISNMFYMHMKTDMQKKRMKYLITTTKKTLYIKGITLKAFFRTNDNEGLFDALRKAALRDGLKVRILLINPDEEQAKLRSFKEYLLSKPSARLNEFIEKSEHERQDLFRDTKLSINYIDDAINEMSKNSSSPDIKLKLYKSAPDCFMLLTDESVLVEQYHYGKISPPMKDQDKIENKLLKGDVPVFEYAKPSDEILKENVLRNPYNIFKDNFEYVFEHCSINYK